VIGHNKIILAAELCFHTITALQAPVFTYMNTYMCVRRHAHTNTHNIGQYNNSRLFSTIFPLLKNSFFVIFQHKQRISQISMILLGFQSYMDAQYQK